MASNIISTALSGASQTITDKMATYFGFAIRETAGAAATVRIRNGTSATGVILETIRLAPNESTSDFYGPQGIRADKGIFVEIVAGTVEGAVRHG